MSNRRKTRTTAYRMDIGKFIGGIILGEQDPDQIRFAAAILLEFYRQGSAEIPSLAEMPAMTADELIASYRRLYEIGWIGIDGDGSAFLASPDDPGVRVPMTQVDPVLYWSED
jgi:hypothetical protein